MYYMEQKCIKFITRIYFHGNRWLLGIWYTYDLIPLLHQVYPYQHDDVQSYQNVQLAGFTLTQTIFQEFPDIYLTI